jgi:hypothetical protein
MLCCLEATVLYLSIRTQAFDDRDIYLSLITPALHRPGDLEGS